MNSFALVDIQWIHVYNVVIYGCGYIHGHKCKICRCGYGWKKIISVATAAIQKSLMKHHFGR